MKVDEDPRIPRRMQDRRNRTVQRAADETARIQVPLVLQLLGDRREQILRDPSLICIVVLLFAALPTDRFPRFLVDPVAGGPSDTEEWTELELGWFGSKTLGRGIPRPTVSSNGVVGCHGDRISKVSSGEGGRVDSHGLIPTPPYK